MSIIAPLTPPQRAEVTKAVSDRFRGRPLDFEAGVTCIHLLREHMLAFGYAPPAIPAFKDAKGAKRALKKAGHANLASLLDAVVGERIAPARMRVGDIVLIKGDRLFDAVMICAGGKLLGWYDDGSLGLINFIPTAPVVGAWRLV